MVRKSLVPSKPRESPPHPQTSRPPCVDKVITTCKLHIGSTAIYSPLSDLPHGKKPCTKRFDQVLERGLSSRRKQGRSVRATMATLATTAVTAQPAAVKGLGNTSLYGVRVPTARVNLPKSRQQRPGSLRTVAKYGEKSVYFDLDDLGNTTGAWDLYGSDAPSPYNSLQSKFFETFAGPFTKRGLLLKFLVLGGGFSLAYLSSTATGDILPIKKGPQLPPKLGPRGKI